MKKSRLWLSCFLLAVASPAHALPDNVPANSDVVAAQALADECAHVLCRKPGQAVTLRTTDGGATKIAVAPYPYLDSKGGVIVFPGENITLGLPKSGDGPPRLLKVTDPEGTVAQNQAAPSETTLSFELHQDAKLGMILTVTNATSASLKYDATMFVFTPQGVRASPTSTCPLLPPQGQNPTFSGIENWHDTIVMLRLSNIRVLGSGAERTCE